MSKIALKPNVSGTGVFSLEAPNSNTDRTLTLPDEAGSVLTNVSDIESQVKTATNATGSAPVYACRAWVNFDGTDPITIRQSGNVSSITDTGVGQYTVNFNAAMPDNFFSAVGSTNKDDAVNGAQTLVKNYSTFSVALETSNNSGQQRDYNTNSVAVFR